MREIYVERMKILPLIMEGLGKCTRLDLFNELKPRKILHWGLARRGTIPGCPLSAHRPGRPPSPPRWPVPASGSLSHAGAALSGHGAGLQVAHTLTKTGATVSTWHRCPNGTVYNDVPFCLGALGLSSSPGRRFF